MAGIILLIEDNAAHRKVYSVLLRAHGYDAIEIADERTAVEIASGAGASAIIVDILLPHIDGRQIIQSLRGNAVTRATPIMAVSAAADDHMAMTCLAAGANLFRGKPIPLTMLAADVAALAS